MNEQLIISSIEGLRDDLAGRMGDMNNNMGALDTRLVKVLEDHEQRLRATEIVLQRVKGAAWVLSGLLGLDGLAHAKSLWMSFLK